MSRTSAGTVAPRDGVTVEDALADRLFPSEPAGIQWGLERTRRILSDLGDPHLAAPALHVGGTNGKGSVATILSSALRAHGLKVGLYTSPHLVSLRERFRVDGAPLPESLLLEAAEEIRPVLETHGPSHFEAGTALAFHLFRRLEVEAVVVEVGLGGRLDATNVILPEVTAVTNVALDHRAYLGRTLAEVAREKAGILKGGVPAVVGETRPRLRRLFRELAVERGTPLLFTDPDKDLEGFTTGRAGTVADLRTRSWGSLSLASPLVGHHQIQNLLVAVRALEYLPPDLRPDRAALLRGVAEARIAGRLQIVERGDRTWILDVAHNPAGARSLARAVRDLDLPRPLTLLAAVLADKDWATMLSPLLREVDRAILTEAPSAPRGRRWNPRDVVGRIVSPVPLHAVPEFSRAFDAAGSDEGSILVTGSCSIVGDALRGLDLEGELTET